MDDTPVTLYEYEGNVVSVHDGDTVRIDIDLGFRTWIFNQDLRLLGINAPEVKGDTKAKGDEARDALRGRILNKRVTLRTVKDRQEKYGRYLAIIFDPDGVNVNEWMVKQGYAIPYMEIAVG